MTAVRICEGSSPMLKVWPIATRRRSKRCAVLSLWRAGARALLGPEARMLAALFVLGRRRRAGPGHAAEVRRGYSVRRAR